MAPAMPSSSKMAQSKVANVAMSAAVDEVMDKLKAMTLLEASELVKAIEETFDVDASAGGGGGMMMMAPGAAGGADAGGAAAEEKTEFDLVLDSFPADKKIAVLKVTSSPAAAPFAYPSTSFEHAAPRHLEHPAPQQRRVPRTEPLSQRIPLSPRPHSCAAPPAGCSHHHRPGPQGGEGARRGGAQDDQGGWRQGGVRGLQDAARGGRRHRHPQVSSRSLGTRSPCRRVQSSSSLAVVWWEEARGRADVDRACGLCGFVWPAEVSLVACCAGQTLPGMERAACV